MYVAMGALAVYFSQWAWKATMAMFFVHMASPIVLLAHPIALTSSVAAISVFQWLIPAAIGAWACMHQGSCSKLLSSPT
jgi:hypothetical protein